jgi:hypothetical protein
MHVREPERKCPLGRSRHRWENSTKVDLGNGMGGCGSDLSGTGWGPAAGFCEHGNETFRFHWMLGFFEQLSNH